MAKQESKPSHMKSGMSQPMIWVITMLAVQLVLSIAILLTISGTVGESDTAKIASIETKVSTMDTFFRNNVQGYGLETGNSGVGSPSGNVDAAAGITEEGDFVAGNPDAEVTVYEFSDYQCPFCRKFWEETYPQLKAEYIDTGKIRFIYKDFALSFHPAAETSAIAANCVGAQLGAEGYYEFHDLIFQKQADTGSAGTVQYGASDLRSWAQELGGVNMAAYDTCVADPVQAAEAAQDLEEGAAAGVTGTPSFVINGNLIVGAQPYTVIKQAIEAELSS